MCRILFILVTLFSCTSCAIWPISWEFNNEKRFLGPLIAYQNENNTNHFTFRPLLATYDSNDGGVYNYLYPLGYAAQEHSYFIPLYRSKRLGDDSDTSLMLLFWGKSKRQGDYGGIFPFYGRLYDRFAKDEMGFALWPMYSFAKSEGATKTNFVWPIFSLYRGTESGFKIFPLYGERKLTGIKESRFYLWPIFFTERKNLDTDEPIDSFYAFPFYLRTKSKSVVSYNILWPFFSYVEGRDTTGWGFFANLISVTKGEQKEGYSFFPFYSYERKERDTQFNILGPLYHESEWYVRNERFFHRRVAVVNRYFEEKDKSFLNVWPFFEYTSEKEDYSFLFPSFLPFRIDNFNRIIKPLYTLYEKRKEGRKDMVSLLYGLYTREEIGENWKTRLAFLFEMKKDKGKIGFEILSGLFGLDNEKVKIFFIPIKRGS